MGNELLWFWLGCLWLYGNWEAWQFAVNHFVIRPKDFVSLNFISWLMINQSSDLARSLEVKLKTFDRTTVRFNSLIHSSIVVMAVNFKSC